MDVFANHYALAIFGFLAVTMTIGIITIRFVKKSGKNYIVAGRSLPFYFVGTMFAAAAIDGNSSLGSVGLIYQFGLWAGIVIPLGVGLTQFQLGALFAKKLNKMRMLTFVDFYYRRYGHTTEVSSSLLMLSSFVILLAGNFAATGFILSSILGIDYFWGILIGALLVMVYTLTGGLFANAYIDFFQIYLGIFVLWAAAIFFLGGFSGVDFSQILASTPQNYIDLSGLTDPANGAYLNWAGLISLTIANTIALDFMERIFAAKDPKAAQRGSFMGGALTLFTVAPVAVLGIVALYFVPNSDDPFTMFPTLATNHVPFWLGALLLMTVVGASMSTANGALLVMGSVFSRNIFHRKILRGLLKRPGLNDRSLLWATRAFVVPVMLGGLFLGYLVPQPGVLVILTFDVVFSGAFACLLFGVYWKRANAAGAMSCIVVGVSLRMALFFIMPAEYAGLDTLIPPAVSAAVFVVVTLLTQKKYPSRHEVIDYVPTEDEVVRGLDIESFKKSGSKDKTK
jgi:solute:Na+ symporter, SSS family